MRNLLLLFFSLNCVTNCQNQCEFYIHLSSTSCHVTGLNGSFSFVNLSRDSYESLSCFKQQWQGGYRHKSPYCVFAFPGFHLVWIVVAFCVLYFVSSAEANYVAFSVKCLEPWPFCATPTVGLQRHLPPAGKMNEMTRSKIRSIYCSRVKDPIQSKESNFPTLFSKCMFRLHFYICFADKFERWWNKWE